MKDTNRNISRREFVKRTSASVAGLTLPIALSSCTSKNSSKLVPKKVLGKTGMEISRLAFGGGSQFMKNKDGEWEPIFEKSLELGINFFDTCYNYGSEGRFAAMLNQHRDRVYVSTKIDAREGDDVKQQFYGSLERLKMAYVDVLMMHAIGQDDDLSTIENGVYKEMIQFQKEKTVKFIGFSTMQETALPVARSLIEQLEFDVILGIINPIGSFGNSSALLPLVKEKNIGFLAMKILRNMVNEKTTARELISYALDKDGVVAAVVAHDGIETLEENIRIFKEYENQTSMTSNREALEQKLEKYAETHTPVWALPGYHDGIMV